jgi:Peptidase family M28/PKD domain
MLGIDHMNIKKIVCLLICTLMMMTVVPVVGYSIQTAKVKITNVTPEVHTPPSPAYASTPRYVASTGEKTILIHPDITATSMSDIVINMLTQVDESIYLSYVQNLTNFGPRKTGTSACVAAGAYIFDQFENMGLWVRYCPWNNGGYSSNNVEATINGTDESSDEIYIICAHYDTVAAGPGADDDTSGTAAVLIAAFIMSQYQFNNTIKFVTFSGEEQGLLGSAVYANAAASQGWNIVGVLNADMISYAITTNDGNNLIVYENTPSEWLYTYTNTINAQYTDYIHLILQHGGSIWGSDHNSFWDAGYDALFYFEYTETPYYHTSGDTMAHINATYAVKNVRLILATLAELSEASYLSNPPAIPTISGPSSGVVNEEYSYSVVTTEPDGENVFYFIDWGDGTNSGWLGPYSPGQPVAAQKTWTAPATYTVQAKAKDINQVSSDWSDPLFVTILVDRAPNTPTISGQVNGNVGTGYLYTITTIDLDGDMVYYTINWGDGQVDEWIGPYASGAIASITHTWDEKGTYTIQVKAKDVFGAESGWGTLEVTMPTNVDFLPSGSMQATQQSQSVSFVTLTTT